MTCRQWEQWLDERLDGQATPGWEHHAAHCFECAARLHDADRLLQAIQQQPPVRVPASLHARLVAAVQDDQRLQRRSLGRSLGRFWARSAALLAAAVLLALGGRFWQRPSESETPSPGRPPVVQGPPVEPPASEVPLRENVQRAGQAVASLTVRTAGEAMESTSTLWPMATVDWPEVQMPPTPPVEPIRLAGERLSTGLEPVTDSARRAMNRFWRDLPLARQTPVE